MSYAEEIGSGAAAPPPARTQQFPSVGEWVYEWFAPTFVRRDDAEFPVVPGVVAAPGTPVAAHRAVAGLGIVPEQPRAGQPVVAGALRPPPTGTAR